MVSLEDPILIFKIRILDTTIYITIKNIQFEQQFAITFRCLTKILWFYNTGAYFLSILPYLQLIWEILEVEEVLVKSQVIWSQIGEMKQKVKNVGTSTCVI